MNRTDQFVTPTERVAALTLAFARGSEMSAAEVARMFDLGFSGAHKMLGRMSAVIPLVVDEEGRWSLLPQDDSQ